MARMLLGFLAVMAIACGSGGPAGSDVEPADPGEDGDIEVPGNIDVPGDVDVPVDRGPDTALTDAALPDPGIDLGPLPCSEGCDDDNPCTDDRCGPDGFCLHDANQLACTDGDACTTGDRCSLGECTGTPVSCDDRDPCTADSCDEATGCAHAAIPSGACDDGNPCTIDEACEAGGCIGQPRDCDDGNPCTLDGCDPTDGCTHVSRDGACEDGEPCTTGDACAGGTCTAGTATSCDDKNACTADDCEPGIGCTHAAADCDDDNPCTTDGCNGTTGCTHEPRAGACDDGNPCTQKDACSAGICAGAALDCDDGNPCTVDRCSQGACTHSNALDNVPCNAPWICFNPGKCVKGACTSTGLNCLDADPCTEDSCSGGTCNHVKGNGPCTDGNWCTVGDRCVTGTCTAGAMDACDDGNPCTADSCDSKLRTCVHAPTSGAVCDDDNACTTKDACQDGTCAGQPTVACDDQDPCTSDLCDSTTGACTHAALTARACNDGNPCTTTDLCVKGACLGEPRNCDDGNPCTADSCSDKTGKCVHSAKACDDADLCTLDACDPKTGACTHHPPLCLGTPCSPAACDPGTGLCVHTPVLCLAATTACTANVCDNRTGTCEPQPWTGPCDDRDPCTAFDTCATGQCKGAPKCDDDNPCTKDACNATTGACGHEPEAEGKACEVPGSHGCQQGRCLSGTCSDLRENPCDDGEPCTADDCDDSRGCFHTQVTPCVLCSGGACAEGQYCLAGLCVPKLPDKAPCDADVQCWDGYRCLGSFCRPVNQPGGYGCYSDAQCATGDCRGNCLSGGCSTFSMGCTCSDTVACAIEDEVCLNGDCLRTSLWGEECSDSRQCPSGTVCNSPGPLLPKACLKEGLGIGSDCWLNDECASGLCLGPLPGNPGTCGCGADSDCGTRHRCILGACVSCCGPGTACRPCFPACQCGTHEVPEICEPGCPGA